MSSLLAIESDADGGAKRLELKHIFATLANRSRLALVILDSSAAAPSPFECMPYALK
jgi:hypothetical protein